MHTTQSDIERPKTIVNLSRPKSEIYSRNKSFVRKYNENYYDITTCKKSIREKGWEEENKKESRPFDLISEEEHKEYEMQNNLRAQRKVFEYAMCNDFEYFVTLTFDRKKIDCSDRKELMKKVRQKLKNYKKYHSSFLYLLIPELHKDKTHYHFHGLVSGLNPEHVKKHRPLKKRMRYNWKYWDKHFGFTSIIELDKNKEKVSKYITKYMTKDIINTFNNDRYIVSRALKKPQVIYETTTIHMEDCDFENEYVKKKKFRSYDALYNVIIAT